MEKMKNIYPVFFTQTDTVVLVEVPDLDIITEGENMINVVEMARDAIELKCVPMEDTKSQKFAGINCKTFGFLYTLRYFSCLPLNPLLFASAITSDLTAKLAGFTHNV